MTPGLVASVSPPRLNFPTTHCLSNGLTIIAEQIPVDAVNLSLWLNIGSAVETDEINGMAHFLEHMIFKGTPTLNSGEFEQLVEQRGAVTNAATSQDYTHYHITTAPQDFAELAPLQVDVVLNAVIPDEAFERERFVILEEIRRADDSPSRRTFQRSMQMAFDQLPYRRPVLGAAEVVAGLTPQQMRDFHQSWYRPPTMTAVAVGNLPVEQLIETVAESFTSAQPEIYGVGGADAGGTFPSQVGCVPSAPDLAEFPYQNVTRQEYVDEKLTQA
ncbi:MAG: pitrilysin family protein, partial [Synechococcales bacterium]|nr:pitrilysin family protein [Synechococcales bacterium]